MIIVTISMEVETGDFTFEDGPGSLMNADSRLEWSVVWQGEVDEEFYSFDDAQIRAFLKEKEVFIEEEEEMGVTFSR